MEIDIRQLPLDDVVLDENLNLRDRLDDETVQRYAETWDRLPPVTVYDVEGRWLLVDGFHRHAAAALLGKRSINAEVRAGALNDALDYAAGANHFHGLPLTRGERRRGVEIKLKLHPEWSDRRISEELSVGRELVAKVRKHLVDAGQVPSSLARVGSDGKLYPTALSRDENERLPTDTLREARELERERDARSLPAEDEPSLSQGNPRGKKGARKSAGFDSEEAVAAEPTRRSRAEVPPWEEGTDTDFKSLALAEPPPPAAPSIDEMLDLMTKQVREVLTWTESDGFPQAYRAAGPASRRAFETVARDLAARVRTLGSEPTDE